MSLLTTPLSIYKAQSVEHTAPRLVEKIYASEKRLLLVVSSQEKVLFMDQLLWTYTPLSFIPHGCEAQDKKPLRHPVWISTRALNVNKAHVIMLFDHIPEDALPACSHFEKILLLCQQEPMYLPFAHISYWRQIEKKWFLVK